jgi:hypothetical protein
MGERGPLLMPRGAPRGVLIARVTLVTCRRIPVVTCATIAPCYHRPCPVVCSVPVTGRTVTMPDGRARSRITSLIATVGGAAP